MKKNKWTVCHPTNALEDNCLSLVGRLHSSHPEDLYPLLGTEKLFLRSETESHFPAPKGAGQAIEPSA